MAVKTAKVGKYYQHAWLSQNVVKVTKVYSTLKAPPIGSMTVADVVIYDFVKMEARKEKGAGLDILYREISPAELSFITSTFTETAISKIKQFAASVG